MVKRVLLEIVAVKALGDFQVRLELPVSQV